MSVGGFDDFSFFLAELFLLDAAQGRITKTFACGRVLPEAGRDQKRVWLDS